MLLTEKDYEEFQKLSKKEGITYKSDDEMRDAANNLYQLAELSLKLAREQFGWNERLKKEPKGFAMDGEGRSCGLCSNTVAGQIWYDKWGLSCMTCHEAYVKGIIPGYAIKDHNNEKSVTASTLAWKSGMRQQTIMKLVRQGKLKARHIPNGATLFLRRENPNLIDVISEEKVKLQSNKKISKQG